MAATAPPIGWADLTHGWRRRAVGAMRAAGMSDAAIAAAYGVTPAAVAAAMRPAAAKARETRAAEGDGGAVESREGAAIAVAAPAATDRAATGGDLVIPPAPAETAAANSSEPDATAAGPVVAARSGATAGETAPLSLRPWAEMPREEKVARVRRLRREGLSASVIGRRLGTTRNAVIGMMHRNGMSLPGVTTHVVRRSKNDRSAAGGRTRSAQVHAGPVSLAGSGRAAGEDGQSAEEDRQSAVGSRKSEEGVERVRRAPPKSGVDAAKFLSTADCRLPTAAGAAGIPFDSLDALFARCRRPLWDAPVPLDEKRWCGAPTVAGRSYCAACLARPLVQTGPGWLKRITGESPAAVPTAAGVAKAAAMARGRAAAKRAATGRSTS